MVVLMSLKFGSSATDADLMSTDEEATDESGEVVGSGDETVKTIECVTCGETEPRDVSCECAVPSKGSFASAPDIAYDKSYPINGVPVSTDESYCYGRKAGAALGGPYEAADCSVVEGYTDYRSVNCSEAADGVSIGKASGNTARKMAKSYVP